MAALTGAHLLAVNELFYRLLKRTLAIAVVLPWLTLFQQRPGSADRKALWIQTGFHLIPIERHRNWRSRSRPRRQRRDRGRCAVVAQIVEKNAPSPELLCHDDEVTVGAI